jgi:glycosyltransferase involved in cell wall biosynthesis
MGSECIRRWYEDAGLLAPGVPVHVLPYGIDPLPGRPHAGRTGPVRFGMIATVMPHKGVEVAVQAFAGLDADLARLEIWGDPRSDTSFGRGLAAGLSDAVQLMGRFDEGDKAEVLARFDVLLIPSIGLESFGIVGREAMSAGVPVIASRLGALAEMPLEDCGMWLPPGDVDGLRDCVERLVEQPETIDRWRRALPPVKTVEQHAAEIEQVYREVLEA